jgi:hypothetical protein
MEKMEKLEEKKFDENQNQQNTDQKKPDTEKENEAKCASSFFNNFQFSPFAC